MKVIISNRIYFPYSEKLATELREKLKYVFPPKTPTAKPEVYCDVTCVGKRAITIPAGRLDLIPADSEIVDKRVMPAYTFPDTNPEYKLWDLQQEVVDQVTESCLINAQPGWGKTFVAMFIAKKLGLKTLIVTHNVVLREQWEKEYFKIFGEKAGVIGSGRQELDNPVVIANVQTLTKISAKVSGLFGTLIMDEVHHVPSTTFKKIVDTSRAKYKIGLSATFKRRDKKELLLYDYFSNKVIKPVENNRMKPSVTRIQTEISLPDNPAMPWATKINQIAADLKYRHLIIDLALKSSEKRKTLVLVDRVEFAEYCSSLTPKSIFIVGSTEERPKLLSKLYTEEVDTIYGTTSIFKEGISVDILKAVILAFPISHENLGMLEQIIGRITRPYEGVLDPVVYDMLFRGSTAKRQANGRLNYYINMGYDIRTY